MRMRSLILILIAVTVVTGCGRELGRSAPSEDAAATTEPAPSEQPSATQEPAQPAPHSSDETGSSSTGSNPGFAPPPAPPPMDPTQGDSPNPSPTDVWTERGSGRPNTRSLPNTDGPSFSATRRVITPVLVELLPSEARAPRQGGSAVALLAAPGTRAPDEKNLALCRALFLAFDRATTEEVDVGSRRTTEGETQLLRPLYWITRQELPVSAAADRCPQRLETYDFPRAASIKRKLGLVGEGPFLVVERADQSEGERVAAVVDLSRARPADIPDISRYFRDGLMQSRDVWDARRYRPEPARQGMFSALGRTIQTSVVPRLVRTTVQVGCAFTDLLDQCRTSVTVQR